jgi:uncharacterized protein VirK/YbjX
LHRSLGNAAKVEMLQQHYGRVLQLPAAVRSQLLSLDNICIASVTGKDESSFSWVMGHNHYFDKEGELSLQFVDAQQVALATLTFTLCQYRGSGALAACKARARSLATSASAPPPRPVTACFPNGWYWKP